MQHDTPEARIEHLRKADFGSVPEMALRYSLALACAALLYLATSDWFFIQWLLVYLVVDSLFAATLICRITANPNRQYALCLALYNLAALSFVSGPLYLLAVQDTALVLVGALGLVALLLNNFHKGEMIREVVYSDAAQFTFVAAALIVLLYPNFGGTYQFMAAVVTAIGVTIYYYLALMGQLSRSQALRAAQHRYAQSQKARALNQFVGGVAHDFNNILTAVIGNLELHGALSDEKERAQVIRQAHEAAHRAAMTVRQLLATSGRARLRPAPISAAALHDQMHALLRDLLSPGITLASEPGDRDLKVLADHDMLETVLVQLCLNAQDALQGRGRIWLRSAHVDTLPDIDPRPEAPPPYMAIIVEDNGPGVPPNALPMLTEPFFTTKPLGQGPGLGLSAVLGFARQSQGSLMVENRPKGGLRVTLLLPLAKKAGETPAQLPGS
ncbi:sensor histidine kinase [Tropicibacter oceani]|uniref:histidine kinase n=1 Tax=Tropicibacter oceani TaxID=3058420 RepID=A0ABY8QEI2_9RHOB|nr:ATP-binding protein [Tropicibacter oceani]WGW03041.1 ATP-binding protein [Tropicibacter oceani]